ncbi:MAG: hypothetical protein V4580_17350, partial [Bacteroidota bacterium]
MHFITKHIIIIFICLVSCISYAQQQKPVHDIDSIIQNWDYRIYPDTEKLKMIEYYPAFAFCGRVYVNALAICVNTRGETIRVIDCSPGPKEFKA